MSSVTIRPARVDEQPALESLQRRASLANPGDREALLAHPEAIALPVEQLEAGAVYLAEADGATVGFAALLRRADGNAQLDALFVDPTAWRRGIGRALVNHCAGRARDWGSPVLFVVGNPHAEAFYQSCGFVIVGSEATLFGPALLLQRIL